MARSVLQDWNGGKIPFYTLPPAKKPTHDLGSSIVSSWGQEINIDALQAADQSVLSALPGTAEFGSNAVVMVSFFFFELRVKIIKFPKNLSVGERRKTKTGRKI